MLNKTLAKEAGLVEGGPNEDGEMEWIGTRRQWNKYRILNDAKEEKLEEVKEEIILEDEE